MNNPLPDLCNFSYLTYRHWQKLMKLTGKDFDMNPDTFTLENLFAMDLHNYAEKISDIVASASKELNIEKSLSEVVSIWQVLKFSVHKYVHGMAMHVLYGQPLSHMHACVSQVLEGDPGEGPYPWFCRRYCPQSR